MPGEASDARFPATHWSVVIDAGTQNSPKATEALNELCQSYWKPLYAYLRSKGKNPQDAEDLVQGFLQTMIHREDFRRANPARGPFRRYLLSCLKHWVINQEVSQKAAKRGGGRVISIDPSDAELLAGADLHADNPEQAYDLSFARTVLARALQRLRLEQEARDKGAAFEVLAVFLEAAEASDYQKAGARLNLSPGAVAQSVRRLRLRLREFVENEVRQTVSSDQEFETELQVLKKLWTG